MLGSTRFAHELSPMPLFQRWLMAAFQEVVERLNPPGLWRLILVARRALFGAGPYYARYRNRFWFIYEGNTVFRALTACGVVHRDLDEVLYKLASGIQGDVVFFDVGANEGFVTLLACSLGQGKGRVIAHCFEPSSTMFARLQENTALNQFPVVLNRCALGSVPGKALLTLSAENFDATMVPGGIAALPKTGEELVDVTALDQYCSENRVLPHIIKIDVEGYEPLVLEGGTRVIHQAQPYLVVEVNPNTLAAGGSSVAGLLDSLRDLGYRLFYLSGESGLYALRGSQRQRTRWQGYLEVGRTDDNQHRLWDVLAVPATKVAEGPCA